MENYKIEFLPEAFKDLDNIFDYILLDAQTNAENTLEKIMNSIETLIPLPFTGKLIQHKSLIYYNFRMLIINPYIVFYRVINETVYIYRILHGASNYLEILKP